MRRTNRPGCEKGSSQAIRERAIASLSRVQGTLASTLINPVDLLRQVEHAIGNVIGSRSPSSRDRQSLACPYFAWHPAVAGTCKLAPSTNLSRHSVASSSYDISHVSPCSSEVLYLYHQILLKIHAIMASGHTRRTLLLSSPPLNAWTLANIAAAILAIPTGAKRSILL